jgi:uncharacterized membrane protein
MRVPSFAAFRWLGAVGLVFLSSPLAVGQEALPQSTTQGTSPTFKLTLCNNTRGKVWFALASRESPQAKDWYVAGWWEVVRGGCRTLGPYPKQTIFIHAMGEGNLRWNGPDFKACVESTRFKHVHYPDAKCDAPLLRGFYKRTASDRDELAFSVSQP